MTVASEVILIDYGVGNLLSVRRALESCGASVIVTSDPAVVVQAKRIVLPGVGAFCNAMKSLRSLGLVDAIHELERKNIPLLGICLGMQLLLDESEEFGVNKGLGLISGSVIPIPNKTIYGQSLKLPNIGWRPLEYACSENQWQNSVLEDNRAGEYTYFVHSYMAITKDSEATIANCNYGGNIIAAVIKKKQIFGCQFHPEKSGKVGLKILKKFISLNN